MTRSTCWRCPAGLILHPARPLPAAGRAFATCLRAYVAELAQRGLTTAITDGDSGAPKNDTTGPEAKA